MKRFFIISIIFNFCTLAMHSQEVDVQSNVNEVTLYHTGALVNRSANLTLSAGPHELVFKNVSSKLLISTLKILDKDVTMLNKTLVKKLSEEELQVLNDRKLALENQLQLLEKKYNEPSFVQDVNELEKMLAYYYERSVSVKRELRRVEKELSDAAELEEIQLKNENAAILQILVSCEKPIKKDISFQYLVGSVAWSPGYEISVDNQSPNTIDINYQAKVINYCGEDWENVTINLSSAFPLSSPTKLPKPDQPWVFSPRLAASNQVVATYGESGDPNSAISDIEGLVYEEVTIPTYIKLRTLKEKYSVKANKTIFSFPIDQYSLPAEYQYFAFPSLDPEAYMVANITEWDELGLVDGYAYISVNGDDVGTTYIKFTEFLDTLTLPIGKDNTVYVKRKEIADEVFSKQNSTSKKFKEKFAFSYDVKNNSKSNVLVKLYEQIPISQTKGIDIDIDDVDGGELDEKIGEVLWTLTLSPGETAHKKLYYNIESDFKSQHLRNAVPPMKVNKYKTVKWL